MSFPSLEVLCLHRTNFDFAEDFPSLPRLRVLQLIETRGFQSFFLGKCLGVQTLELYNSLTFPLDLIPLVSLQNLTVFGAVEAWHFRRRWVNSLPQLFPALSTLTLGDPPISAPRLHSFPNEHWNLSRLSSLTLYIGIDVMGGDFSLVDVTSLELFRQCLVVNLASQRVDSKFRLRSVHIIVVSDGVDDLIQQSMLVTGEVSAIHHLCSEHGVRFTHTIRG